LLQGPSKLDSIPPSSSIFATTIDLLLFIFVLQGPSLCFQWGIMVLDLGFEGEG